MADVQKSSRVKSVLEDPSAQAGARVYANALLDAAGSDATSVIEEFQSFVTDVLDVRDDFRSLLLDGFVTRDERIGILERTIVPSASRIFGNFLLTLARHDRLPIIDVILQVATLAHEKRQGQQRVQVVSARPLDQRSLTRVNDELAARFGFQPIIENTTDEKLIGGLVIRVGNTVYDGSLRTRLNQLARRMQQGSLHEIQSGRDRFSHPEGD